MASTLHPHRRESEPAVPPLAESVLAPRAVAEVGAQSDRPAGSCETGGGSMGRECRNHGMRDAGRRPSDTRLVEEVEYLPGAAVGLILEEEMANSLQRHQLGFRDLAGEARRVINGDVLVPLSPED